jgi:microcystin-dependent protein
MSDPFVGEIRTFGFNFAPQGWAMCNGQLLSISQNTALFSLLGTNYGGDGRSTFALPNLQSRVPIHQGQGAGLSPYVIGTAGGVESVSLTGSQGASHGHLIGASGGDATAGRPGGAVLARTADEIYGASPDGTTLNATTVQPSAGGTPHNNIQPYLVLNFCIALFGIFPSRN